MQINSEMERILLEQQSATQSSTSSSNTSTAFSSLLNNELTATEESMNDSASALAGLQSKATTNSLFTPADIAANQTDEDVQTVAASGGMGKVGGAKAGGASDDEDDDDEYSELDLLEGLTDTMDELETYVSSVQNTATLKEAWASLDAMTQSVEEMQEEYANQNRQNPEANSQMGAMGSLLNELEVMTVTETYKFNRGDYL